MPLNRLRALQRVLSQTRDVIGMAYGIDDAEAFKRVATFIRENSRQWYEDAPAIDYSDPYCRLAYIYMNVAVHAALVEQAFGSFLELRALVEQRLADGNDLNVCALGGGPGSELLGLVRFIESVRKPGQMCHLDFLLVDRINEWDESWHALKKGVDEELASTHPNDIRPVVISRSFLPLDVLNEDAVRHFALRFRGVDVLIVAYLVSELKGQTDQFAKFLAALRKQMGPQVLILFIDRSEKWVRESIEALIPALGMRTLQELASRGRLEDDLHDFGEWYINIEDLPRRNWLTYFALAGDADS